MAFHSWRDVVRDLEPNPSLPAGMSRRSIVGDHAMLCMHEAFPHLKCSPHQHEAEQFSIVLAGRVRFVIGNEERVLGPGEVAHIPGGVPHSIESLEEYVQVLDVFSPQRSDIIARLQEIGHPEAVTDVAPPGDANRRPPTLPRGLVSGTT